ncbi:MAG: hypothetical protein JKX81_10645 [Arenicella sp.]|nr:hypothetical protein [Arenicella sp.]
MNNVFAKLVTLIVLLCYTAGASVAAMHALPMSMGIDLSASSVSAQGTEITSDCHQNQSNSDQAASKSMSACKIFCAAMTNVVSDNLVQLETTFNASTLIAFMRTKNGGSEPSMEPHPPK